MALSRDGAIVKADIESIVELKKYKVFLLEGAKDDKLVLKCEGPLKPEQIKGASTVVKVIDATVTAKILSANERKEINDWISGWEDMEKVFKDFLVGKEYRAEEKAAVTNLKSGLASPDPWMKLAWLDVKDLEKALRERLAGDKSVIKQFISALVAKGGLEKLGKVVAADMIIGNTDRFKPKGAKTLTIGAKQFPFKTLVNAKNVFIAIGTTKAEVSALDYVDTTFGVKDLKAPLSDSANPWTGRVLVDKKKREAFANDIAGDLEMVLSPNKHKWSPFSKLGRDAGARIAAGMVAGVGEIKNKVEAHYRPPKVMPVGVQERYDILRKLK